MSPEEAIKLLRSERPGAINLAQTAFVLKYEVQREGSACCFSLKRTK